MIYYFFICPLVGSSAGFAFPDIVCHGRRGGCGHREPLASGGDWAGGRRARRHRGWCWGRPGRGQNSRRLQLVRLASHRPRRATCGQGRWSAAGCGLITTGRGRSGARAAPRGRTSHGPHLRAAMEGVHAVSTQLRAPEPPTAASSCALTAPAVAGARACGRAALCLRCTRLLLSSRATVPPRRC